MVDSFRSSWARTFYACVTLLTLATSTRAHTVDRLFRAEADRLAIRSVASAPEPIALYRRDNFSSNGTEEHYTIFGLPTAGPLRADPNYTTAPANASAIIASLPSLVASYSISHLLGSDLITIALANNGTDVISIATEASFLSKGMEGSFINITSSSGAQLNSSVSGSAARQDLLVIPQPQRPGSLTSVAPGQNITHSFFVDQIFLIPQGGQYTISIPPSFEGGDQSTVSDDPKTSSTNANGLYAVRIDNNTFTNVTLLASRSGSSSSSSPLQHGASTGSAGLGSSQTSITRRARHTVSEVKVAAKRDPPPNQGPPSPFKSSFTNCDDTDTQNLIYTINEVKRMAERARNDSHYQWLRKLYFNNLWHDHWDRWTQVLDQLIAFETTSATIQTTYIVCGRDSSADGGWCKDNPTLYGKTSMMYGISRIYICNPFWDLPRHNSWFPNKIWWGETPYDWPTVMANLLTASKSLMGEYTTIDVHDDSWYTYFISAGKDLPCVRFSCTIALADNGIFDGGDWGGHTALDNAMNWAYYLKSIRDCYDGSINGALACWAGIGG